MCQNCAGNNKNFLLTRGGADEVQSRLCASYGLLTTQIERALISEFDFPSLNAQLLNGARAILSSWFTNGKIQGHEFKVGNLAGDKGESLSVNLSTGVWADFAANESGGDLISLYAAIHGINQGDAYKELAGQEFPASQPPQMRQHVIGITKPPADAGLPPFTHPTMGKAVAHWCYRDESGDPVSYVSRHEQNGERKQIFPWSWDGKASKWRMRSQPRPRPLYGLELLAAKANARVCIVEGEKAADAARQIIGSIYVVVTWPGGVKAVHNADWRPLTGRKILIWPDADKPGREAAKEISELLATHCQEIKIIETPGKQDGWDAADALAEGINLESLRRLVSGNVTMTTENTKISNPPQVDLTPNINNVAPPESLDKKRKGNARETASPERNHPVQPPIDAQPSDGRLEIIIKGGDLPEQIDLAEQSLMAHPSSASVFQRGGLLVESTRLPMSSVEYGVRRSAGALILRALTPSRLVDLFTQAAIFKKWDARMKDYKRVDCPKDTAIAYLSRPSWSAKPLSGISEGPTLRPDGSILETEGYDDATGLLLDFGGNTFPPINQNPTRDDALAAIAMLKELFSGFPFVSPAHRSAALSAPLTGSIRRSLHAAPMIPLSATAPGTGKSLFTDVVSIILTGREAAAMSQGNDEAEDEKRLMASLMGGDLVLNIDNIEKTLKGGTICSILTQTAFRGRILGESRMLTLPTDVLIMANGNNLELAGDITSRAVLIQMDAGVERPELRKFSVDLRKEAASRRPEFLAACLTILRAHHVAGRPLMGLNQWGRFEDWNSWIRAALVWLGEADPLETTEDLRKTDPTRENILNFLSAWHAHYGDMSIPLHRAVREATHGDSEDLEESILALAGDSRNKINMRILSWSMRRHQGQIVGGYRISRNETFSASAARWRVDRPLENTNALPAQTPPRETPREEDLF